LSERLRIEELDRDDWNREHIRKHEISPEEVAEVLSGKPVIRDTYKNRLGVIGPTLSVGCSW
jgi:hypothetical protein